MKAGYVVLLLGLLVFVSCELDEMKAASFKKFLKQAGFVMHTNVEVKEYEEMGLGLATTKKFSKGDTIFGVPERLVVSPYSAMRSPLGPALRALNLDVDVMVATHLVFESGNKRSMWGAWLKMLPKVLHSTPFWKHKELKKLMGSGLIGVTEGYNQYLDQLFTGLIRPAVDEHSKVMKEEVFTMENFKWAMGIQWSRRVQMVIGGQDVPAVIPLFDFINHKAGENLTLSLEKNMVVVKADRDYEEGEQIFFDWQAATRSERSNAATLLQYGFVPEENDDNYVMVSLNPKDDSDLGSNKPKIDIMKKHGLWHEKYEIRADMSKSNALKALRVFYMDKREMKKKLWKRVLEGKKISDANEGDVIQAAIPAIVALLDAFPTKIKPDEEKLATETNPRYRLALKQCISEKKLLLAALKSLSKLKETIGKATAQIELDDTGAHVKFTEEDKEIYGLQDGDIAIEGDTRELKNPKAKIPRNVELGSPDNDEKEEL